MKKAIFYFYENSGQVVDQNLKANTTVKYLFNSNGLNVQLKKNGFSYDVYETEKIKSKTKELNNQSKIDHYISKNERKF
jgi:beta-lactam-binding protein with PASTA domain